MCRGCCARQPFTFDARKEVRLPGLGLMAHCAWPVVRSVTRRVGSLPLRPVKPPDLVKIWDDRCAGLGIGDSGSTVCVFV
jgi:hypothetical protein